MDKKETLHRSPATNHQPRLIKLGVIATAHGVRGQVKIRSFTADPNDITAYGPLSDTSGRNFRITVTGGTKDALIASVEGVATREAAEALRNTELFILRSALPAPTAHQYYYEDLAGLKLTLENGEAYGTIAGVHNFGAGDLVSVIKTSGEEEFLPFTRATFPNIDIENGVGVIVPPEIVANPGHGGDHE